MTELNESFVADVPGKINADEATWALIKDPNNLYNLSLSSFRTSKKLFIGRIKLRQSRNWESLCQATTNDTYNMRVDYFVLGMMPIV